MDLKIERFQDLMAWQKAHDFVLLAYKLTRHFPDEEKYGLVSQMRRAAVSIPANIAEGFVKRSQNDKIRYYNIAQGSLEECKYYLVLSKDLGYLQDPVVAQTLADEIGRILNGLINSIKRTHHS